MEKLNLKYDVNALVMIEEMSGGKALSDIVNDPKTLERLTTIRMFLWAGLLHANSKLSLAEAGKLLQERINSGEKLEKIGIEIAEAILDCGIIERAPAEPAEGEDPANPPGT